MSLKQVLIKIIVISVLSVQIYPFTLAQAIDTETVEIKQSLEGIEGLLQESSQVNLKADTDSVGMAKINNIIIDIPKNPDEAVSLKTGNTEINISLPELDNHQEGEIVAKGVVAYTSESDFSNTVQANNDGSVRMTTIIDNPNAPTEYEYKVELEHGGKIELQSDGSAIVYNNKQEPISIIAKPWAKDAEGKEVKTWFSTDGLTLIQHVEHNVAGIVYPIVADPVFIPAAIVSAIAAGCVANIVQDIGISAFRVAIKNQSWNWRNKLEDLAWNCAWGGVLGGAAKWVPMNLKRSVATMIYNQIIWLGRLR